MSGVIEIVINVAIVAIAYIVGAYVGRSNYRKGFQEGHCWAYVVMPGCPLCAKQLRDPDMREAHHEAHRMTARGG